MSPRSLFIASKGRRTPGKPGRFDPTEPLHMTTRHAARNGRPNGTSPTSASIDENDSRRGSIDDFRPTTSQSLGSRSSSKGRRHSANSTNGTSDANISFESQSLPGNATTKELTKALAPGQQPSSPTRKRKRSTPTPPQTPDAEDDEMTPPQNELIYRDPRDVVEVIPQDDLSDRESEGSADSDEEQYAGDYGAIVQSTDATPAGSEPVSPVSEESHDGLFPAKPAEIVMTDVDQQAEVEDPDDLDDAEDLVDPDGIEDGDELDDDADTQGIIGYDGRPRRRLAGRRRAEHHDPIIEAALRRQLQLRSNYRAIARSLKPVLAEIALKTTEQLNADPILHEHSMEYQGTDEYPGIQHMLDQALAKRKAQLNAQLGWNKLQLLRTFDGETEVRMSRCKLQIEDLQQLQVDRLQHDVLTLARHVQVSNDNAGYETENEDADVIPKPKGMGYRFQRSSALDSEYDSRSRLAMESERAVDDLRIRFDMQRMIQDAYDEQEVDEATATNGFTVMDNRAREAALARREWTTNTDMLANAAVETERLAAEAERKVMVPTIANKDAIGLQLLGELASQQAQRPIEPVPIAVPVQGQQLPQPAPPPFLPPPVSLPRVPSPTRPPVRRREQRFGPSERTGMAPPAPLSKIGLGRPISFDRKPHDPLPRKTAFPDPFSNPPPPPLTARPEHIPGHTRRLADPRRTAEATRLVAEPRPPESPHRVPKSPRRIPESPRHVPESPRQTSESPWRAPQSPRHDPPPFLTPSGMMNRVSVQSLSLMPPTTALSRRRESPPPTPRRLERMGRPETSSAKKRPQSSHSAKHEHRDPREPDWQGFTERFDGSPRATQSGKRAIHEFSGGHLSIQRVEPVEPRDAVNYQALMMTDDEEEAQGEEAGHLVRISEKLPAHLEAPSNPGAQDARAARERSPRASMADLIRDALAEEPRSRANSIKSQSTNPEASPDDNNMSESSQHQTKQKSIKPHNYKANKAERNGMTRKAFKLKNNGPGPTIHRFRLGQSEPTPTSTPTTASWHSTSGSYPAYGSEHPQYGYGGYPVGPQAPPNYGPPYAQGGYGYQHQHRNSLSSYPWPPQQQSPLYAIPQGSHLPGAGLPPPPDYWPPPPGYDGGRQGPQTPQSVQSTPGQYNGQYGGPPIAPATPDTRLMRGGTRRSTSHLPAFAQQQKKDEAKNGVKKQSEVPGSKFQHYEPRRS